MTSTQPSTSRTVVPLAFVFLLWAQSVDASPTAASEELEQVAQERGIEFINEVSNRRRLNLLFKNTQKPEVGEQVNFVNTSAGNLTFIQRDHVVVDRLPIIIGRVYDSRIGANSDFGPGWKLTLSEEIRHTGSGYKYIDSNGSKYHLQREGQELRSRMPRRAITGRIDGSRIVLRFNGIRRVFESIDGSFRLVRLSDVYGNAITLRYTQGQISGVVSNSGIRTSFERDASGRIASVHEGGQIRRSYSYDTNGRLARVLDSLEDRVLLQYDYSADNLLEAIRDGESRQISHFEFDRWGRATKSHVLTSSIKFRYEESETVVRNVLGEERRFMFNGRGLTIGSVDSRGVQTIIEREAAGHGYRLLQDGQVVASLESAGRQLVYGSAQEGGWLQYEVDLEEGRRIKRVTAPDGLLFSTEYDDEGAVVSMNVRGTGERRYVWDDFGGLVEFQEAGRAFDIDTDSRGRIERVANESGHSTELEFGASSTLRRVSFSIGIDADFEYDGLGFRRVARYSDGQEVRFEYDQSGNMTDVEFYQEGEQVRADNYVIGEGNELLRIETSAGEGMKFGHDSLGRVTSAHSNGREFLVSYDHASRIERATLDGEVILDIPYGVNDPDRTAEFDTRTFIIMLPAHPGNGIFGRVEELVYNRPEYIHHRFAPFSEQLGRFVPARIEWLLPDESVRASLARRNLVGASPNGDSDLLGPWHFDKPSSALFVPPTYNSVNCLQCIGVVFNHQIAINGSQSPVDIDAGDTAIFDSDAMMEGCYQPFPSFAFADMTLSIAGVPDYTSYPGPPYIFFPSASVSRRLDEPGSERYDSYVSCSCGLFGVSVKSITFEVICSDTFRTAYHLSNFQKNNKLPISRTATLVSGDFMACASSQAAVDRLQSSIVTYWNKTFPQGGGAFSVTRRDTIDCTLFPVDDDIDIEYEILLPGPSEVNPSAAQGGTSMTYNSNHTPDDVAHEFGHILGFADTYVVQGEFGVDTLCFPVDIMGVGSGDNTFSYHFAVLAAKY
ncbi:MAG: DUF6531 domain-containing protein [Pseudomonadota bacterium]